MRTGNIVLFHVPGANHRVEMGLVISIWKGARKPKLSAAETLIDNCNAFRVVQLHQASQDSCKGSFHKYLHDFFDPNARWIVSHSE